VYGDQRGSDCSLLAHSMLCCSEDEELCHYFLHLLQACMSLFPTLVEYVVYSHLPYFLYIAAMLCCSEDVEYVTEDFF
jgi:hypothetical protein